MKKRRFLSNSIASEGAKEYKKIFTIGHNQHGMQYGLFSTDFWQVDHVDLQKLFAVFLLVFSSHWHCFISEKKVLLQKGLFQLQDCIFGQ